MTEIEIRRAWPHVADVLRRICLESKRSWGYSDAFMSRFSHDVSVDAASIEVDPVFGASRAGEMGGWLRVLTDRESMILDDLWVAPAHVGQGVGRQLFTQAIAVVRRAGGVRLELDSDPNAQRFDKHRGWVKIGETFTSMGRFLPRRHCA